MASSSARMRAVRTAASCTFCDAARKRSQEEVLTTDAAQHPQTGDGVGGELLGEAEVGALARARAARAGARAVPPPATAAGRRPGRSGPA